MKSISPYYRLAFLSSVVVLITVLSSITMLYDNLSVLNAFEYFTLQCLAPIFPGVLFIMMDVMYISNYHDIIEIYSKKNRITHKDKIIRVTKFKKQLSIVLYITSILVIILGIIEITGLLLGMYNIPVVEGVISYFSLLVLGITHLYVLNKRLYK